MQDRYNLYTTLLYISLPRLESPSAKSEGDRVMQRAFRVSFESPKPPPVKAQNNRRSHFRWGDDPWGDKFKKFNGWERNKH